MTISLKEKNDQTGLVATSVEVLKRATRYLVNSLRRSPEVLTEQQLKPLIVLYCCTLWIRSCTLGVGVLDIGDNNTVAFENYLDYYQSASMLLCTPIFLYVSNGAVNHQSMN
jgi:hypothetical protein